MEAAYLSVRKQLTVVVLAGIDEAGFGPILGPLVVSSTAFALPRQLMKNDMWKLLDRSVGRRRRKLCGRLLIADSKKAYNRSIGIAHLERTVLAAMRCRGSNPRTVLQLLSVLEEPSVERIRTYPWYSDIENRLLSPKEADLRLASTVFGKDLAANGMELLAIKSRCLDVGHYNQMVAATKNKAAVLFSSATELIAQVLNNHRFDRFSIIIDRHGGRLRYDNSIRRSFPEMALTILHEGPARSSYELADRRRKVRLHFVAGADDRFLPVSLASMVSKYVRELMMGGINSYFAAACRNLKPTAGYWKDGLRFIEDLRKKPNAPGFDSDRLIRCR